MPAVGCEHGGTLQDTMVQELLTVDLWRRPEVIRCADILLSQSRSANSGVFIGSRPPGLASLAQLWRQLLKKRRKPGCSPFEGKEDYLCQRNDKNAHIHRAIASSMRPLHTAVPTARTRVQPQRSPVTATTPAAQSPKGSQWRVKRTVKHAESKNVMRNVRYPLTCNRSSLLRLNLSLPCADERDKIARELSEVKGVKSHDTSHTGLASLSDFGVDAVPYPWRGQRRDRRTEKRAGARCRSDR